MEELKPRESEALDILEAMLDVCDLENPGPMFAGQHVRGGICKITDEDATQLRQYIANRRVAPENKALTAQWISAKDKLPEIGQRVAVKCNELYHGMFDVLCYYPDYKPWKTNGVAWWTPIPELSEDACKPEGSEKHERT